MQFHIQQLLSHSCVFAVVNTLNLSLIITFYSCIYLIIYLCFVFFFTLAASFFLISTIHCGKGTLTLLNVLHE